MAYILYHAGCYDGFGAAWAFYKSREQETHHEEDVYLPVSHGAPMPEIPDGHEVVLLDFSYPEQVIRDLCERSYFVTLLDHHKTAEADLRGLKNQTPPNLALTFDMGHSGAYLAWKEFIGGVVPQLILYIEDRDLWKKQLPYHEQVTAYIQSYERTFGYFNGLQSDLEDLGSRDIIVQQGDAILRFKERKVKEVIEASTRFLTLGGHSIPVCNSPYIFASDVGEELLKQYPDAPFAAYYFDRTDGIRQWGLRSRRDFDCSVIAKMYHGGGHAQACGFQHPAPAVTPNADEMIPRP